MIDVIKEFLVSLGFAVDPQSVSTAEKTIDKTVETIHKTVKEGAEKTDKEVSNTTKSVEKKLSAIGEGLKNNKALQGFISKATGMANRFAAKARAWIVGFLSTVPGLIIAAIGIITPAIIALGVLVTGILAKIMKDAAAADIKAQIFARRMFTTVENARSLLAVMQQMGVNNLDELNDIALNPELRKQFLELRALSKEMSLGGDQAKGFQNIRAVGLEFQKLGLVMNYFFQRLGGDLGDLLEGPLKQLKDFMAGFNNFLKNSLPEAGHALAAAVGIAGNLLGILGNISSIMLNLPLLGKVIQLALEGVNDQLTLINSILGLINRLLGKLAKPFQFGMDAEQDLFKTKEDSLGQIASATQGIWDIVRSAWDAISRFFRPFQDFIRPVTDWLGKHFASGQPQSMPAEQKAAMQANAWAPAGSGFTAPLSGGALGKFIWATKDKSSAAINNWIQSVIPNLTGAYSIYSAMAHGGHAPGSRHYRGQAVDIGGSGKTVPQIVDLVASILKSDQTTGVNIEFAGAKYAAIMQGLRAKGIAQDPRIYHDTRFTRGEHIHADVKPVEVSIQINGYNKDPQALASAIAEHVRDLARRDTRSLQSQIV